MKCLLMYTFPMPVLRGHHLICLHFFSGEGYDLPFIEHLGAVVRAAATAPILICSGPDDVCRKCPWLRGGSCTYNSTAEADVREMDRDALRLLDLVEDRQTSWAEVRELLPRVFGSWHRSWCRTCEWRNACLNNESYARLLRNSL